jgi:large subunit ribosomal protein L2
MAVKKYKPTSPGRRGMTISKREQLSKGNKPEKKLVSKVHNPKGRNNYGRITSRFRGGGHKRLYRKIDFKRDKYGVPGKVHSIQYDPNRTPYIALIHYADGEKRYILAPAGLEVGQTIISSAKADIQAGNSMPLSAMPLGSTLHNLEIKIGKGGQLVRTAGSSARLMAREGDWCQIRLPSGEVRKVHVRCHATIGVLSNSEHSNIKLGKAGRRRWMGRRPHQRGVVMNPVDHPMGGGEGRTSGGRNPVTPWGKPTKGYRTRTNKRTQFYIVSRRKK